MNLKTTGHKRQAVCIAAILMLMEEKFNNIIFCVQRHWMWGQSAEWRKEWPLSLLSLNHYITLELTPLPDSCGLIEFYNSNFYTVVHFGLDLIYLTWLTVVILQVYVPVVDQDLQKRMGGWGGGGVGLCSSRPSDKAMGGGGGLLSKNFFPLFGPQFGLKNNKGGRWAPPQDLPLCTLQVHNSHG